MIVGIACGDASKNERVCGLNWGRASRCYGHGGVMAAYGAVVPGEWKNHCERLDAHGEASPQTYLPEKSTC